MFSPLSLPSDFELSNEFKQCSDTIENTDKFICIQGAAGCGKSVLLNYIRQNTKKNMIVLAPTGISAINIQGQTIHSCFHFPHTLIQKEDIKKHFATTIFEKLELLIIDEISMVRPDLLDGVDYALRLNRDCFHLPFGGVQVVLIGDIFQLPPILGRELAEHFLELYSSRYFFSAKSFEQSEFYSFELTKNYRQKDQAFLSILNKVRNNTLLDSELRAINSRVNPQLADVLENCIRLVPTNAKADSINHSHLAKLPGDEFYYPAKINGIYDRRSYPADELLRLKAGAQVLMIKNDPDKRWVNGSLGKVLELQKDGMKVQIDHGIYEVQPVTWANHIYRHDSATGRIVNEPIGTFEQFPVRLAWAVTIHKSQSQTFNRVIVDLDSGSFVHGQTYTALSRVRNLEGLFLSRPIYRKDIIFDPKVYRLKDFLIPFPIKTKELMCANGSL